MRAEDEDVLDIPLHGRFCGNDMEMLPKLLISMDRIFILGFYTDAKNVDRGFQGIFTFIDGCKLNFIIIFIFTYKCNMETQEQDSSGN